MESVASLKMSLEMSITSCVSNFLCAKALSNIWVPAGPTTAAWVKPMLRDSKVAFALWCGKHPNPSTNPLSEAEKENPLDFSEQQSSGLDVSHFTLSYFNK